MKILVTGGGGFLGHHVLQKFRDADKRAVFAPPSKQVDLYKRDQLITYLRAAHFNENDVILHMAAVCGGILANKNSPADFLHKNVDMTSNVFHAAKEVGVKKIYTLGSVCAYPKFCPTPFKENDLWNGYPEETNAPYGMAKRLQLMMSQTYRQQYGIGGAHFIPVNMYGEHDNFHPVTSHVIPALIRKFLAASRMEHPVVECWGTGKATREFLYAGDCADALVKAVLNNFDCELPINLGVGQDISIKDLSELIGNLMQYEGDIIFTGGVSDGQPKRMLDVSRAKELLDWTAMTSFEVGLRRTIDWFREENAIAEMDAWGG